MSRRLTENTTIPALGTWITLPEAGALLGVSRQHAYNRASAGHFKSLHRIGASMFVVDRNEVERIIAQSLDNSQDSEVD